MPGRTFNRDHGSRWVSKEIVCETRHQGKCVGKSGAEETDHVGSGCQPVEAVSTFKRQKQDAGKRAVNVGQGDQHATAPRPDVKSVLVKKMFATRARWNRQLFVPVVEILLRKVESRELQHFCADSRRRPVAANCHLGLNCCLFRRLLMAQAYYSGLKIESRALPLEVNAHPLRFSRIHQSNV